MSKKRKRAKIGDVIKIPVKGGFAYSQYSHHHTKYGELMALLPGVYSTELTIMGLEDLANQKALYFYFLPLQSCLRRGEVEIIDNKSIPDSRCKFPIMRSRRYTGTNEKREWNLWDGFQATPILELTPEQYDLSIRGVWGFELLVLRVNDGWKPRDQI